MTKDNEFWFKNNLAPQNGPPNPQIYGPQGPEMTS